MFLFDLFFPKQCLNCKKYGSYVCNDCGASFPIVKQKCIVCERPSIDGWTHEKCKGKYTIDRTISLWEYKGGIRKALIGLKYKFAKEIVDELTNHILRSISSSNAVLFQIAPNSILLPIPMHWHRKNWRGFNQVEEIGESLSSSLSLRYEPNILLRTEKRQAQATLNSEQRTKNIEGVFSLNPSHQSQITNHQSLFLLFDDVYTTGATLKEAGKVLKKAGVRQVWALTIAR